MKRSRQSAFCNCPELGDLLSGTVKVMNRIMSNVLMAKFNMRSGAQLQKKPFGATSLYNIIQDAVKRWSPNATDSEIEVAMAEHLKHAPGRGVADIRNEPLTAEGNNSSVLCSFCSCLADVTLLLLLRPSLGLGRTAND